MPKGIDWSTIRGVSVNKLVNSGVYIGPTKSYITPKNYRFACLCLDGRSYSRRCCNGYLANQGIGQTIYPAIPDAGGFSQGFSNGFNDLNAIDPNAIQ